MPLSSKRWSRLRALQRRQAATTLSQAWGPPFDLGTMWSMFSAWAPQYWQRWPSRAKYRPPVEGHVRLVGHFHEVGKPNHGRLSQVDPGRVVYPPGACQQLCLCLEHEQQRTPGGHNAERLVCGVEDERSRHALAYLCMRGVCIRGTGWGIPTPAAITSAGTKKNLARKGSHPATPLKVSDDLRAAERAARRAEHRLEPERHVTPRWHGHRRPPRPPPRAREGAPLGQRGQPEPWPASDVCQSAGARRGITPTSPRGSSHSTDVTPPRRPAPQSGGSQLLVCLAHYSVGCENPNVGGCGGGAT